ncbi:MAG: hypothetical protein IKG46_04175 [Solobacterium sp.]|nr:hypothetical protein [Solobacterium sp.]
MNIVFMCIIIPVAVLFTALGIYAWKRTEPMWFWSGSSISADEIADVKAYNRANGIMWLAFSMTFWISILLALFQVKYAGIFMIIAVVGGGICLPIAYTRILDRYQIRK